MQSVASGMLKSPSKRYFRKRYLTAALILAVSSGTAFIRYYTRNKVVSFTRPRSILDTLSPHGGYTTTVIAHGLIFDDIAGHEPYYLSSPNCDRIVIYTKLPEESRLANILNTGDASVVSVKIPGSDGFGNNVGIKSEGSTDRFECISSNRIILFHRSEHVELAATIDLPNTSLISYEVMEYDSNGIITNRWNVR